MGRGVRTDKQNTFDKKCTFKDYAEFQKGAKESLTQLISNLVATAKSIDPAYIDSSATAAASITLPNVDSMIGRTVTFSKLRATTNAPANVNCVAPTTGESIIGQTTSKGLFTFTQGSHLKLLGTPSGWVVTEKEGTWTEEP